MPRRNYRRALVVRHYQAGRQVCSCGCGHEVIPHWTKSGKARFVRGHNGRGDLASRFWDKVEKRGPDDCWPWMASVGGHGYGQLYRDGSPATAQRISYELAHGAIPADLHIDHLCANKLCVNPAHLEAVTPGENTRRHYRRTHLEQRPDASDPVGPDARRVAAGSHAASAAAQDLEASLNTAGIAA